MEQMISENQASKILKVSQRILVTWRRKGNIIPFEIDIKMYPTGMIRAKYPLIKVEEWAKHLENESVYGIDKHSK